MYKILDNYKNYKIYKNGEIYDIKNEKFILPFLSKKNNNYIINIKNNNNKTEKKYISRFIFESFNGIISKNEQIIFKDNINSNFNIDNLDKKKTSTIIKDKKYIHITTDIYENNQLWKIIPEFENYKISSNGEILSANSGIIKPKLCTTGYYIVTLSKNNIPKKFLIHRLVFEIFNDKIINKNNVIDHIDQNKINNNINNLREVTRNINGINVNRNNLINHETIIQYDLQDNIIKEWNSRVCLMKEFKINNCNNITRCCLGQQKTAYKFKWLYKNRITNFSNFNSIKSINDIFFSNYKINEDGIIINLKGQIIQSHLSGEYLSVLIISDNLTKHKFSIHRLVANTFIENLDKNKNIVNHIDENKLNNNINNLEWVSSSENSTHSIGKSINMIDPNTNNIIKNFKSIKEAFTFLGKKYYNSSICDVCEGKKKLYNNYKWSWN
jgi:hypothetical protein